jgi:hypothetical protein
VASLRRIIRPNKCPEYDMKSAVMVSHRPPLSNVEEEEEELEGIVVSVMSSARRRGVFTCNVTVGGGLATHGAV